MKNIIKQPLALLLMGLGMAGAFTSCEKDEPEEVIVEPIVLDCNYFNTDRVLTDNPDAPVDYIVTCLMSITNANITIEPGVVIHFQTDAGIRLNGAGSLKAEGTAAKPIRFSSATTTKGSWRGLILQGQSVNNVFDHCVIEYAGGSAFEGRVSAIIVWANSRLKVHNTTISNSAGNGIEATLSSTVLDLNNNNFKDNAKAPLRVSALQFMNIDGNSDYAGNTENFVQVVQYTERIQSGTIQALNVPYRVTNRDNQYINIEGNVVIEPGTTIEFGASTGLRINEDGSLKAVGTATDRITFTGVDKAPGAWGGLYFNFTTSVLNEVAYATIEYAGNSNFPGAIYMWAKPTVKVNNVIFKDIATCGMFAAPNTSSPNTNLTESDNTFNNVAGGDICGS